MEQQVPGAVAPPSPAADTNAAPVTPAPVDQSAEATNAGNPEEGTTEPQKQKEHLPPWVRRQVTKARDRAIAAETRAAMLEERLSRLEQTWQGDGQTDGSRNAPPSAQQDQPVDPYTIRAQVEERVAFDMKSNAAFDNGVKEFGKGFEESLESLKTAGINERALKVIVESDAPHKVLHYLGTNPEVAEDIFDLPPVQMARALGRIEAQLSLPPKPPKASSAPDPVKPVTARADTGSAPSPRDDVATWMAKRNAQLAARGGR